ncbi:MAG: DUF1566 domain-containing protein [Sandaracinus sp.]|nr:DUF1566 domain-containing protein [Sandaracinus sp.]MCB9615650.1 DUF1566 domain-containing protein [Sandaracinus sp.]MCB9618739.1 DUF1566 domain-containing protein [Sandaracinus sp.]
MRDPSERTFVLEGADVVRDEVTGLRWMRVSASARPWDEARDFCAAATFGGRDDWRLPARVELASILDAGRTPSFDTAFFEGAADYVWTASRPAGSDVAAFAIYFGQGETVSAGVAVGGGHVRCVAGARDAVVVGTVDGEHVRHGGLRWRRTVSEPSDYAGAAAFCEALGERLPSLYEMHDLVDEAREAPAIDGLLFPETPTDRYWTSTIRDFGEILSWTVDFVIGASELVERSTTARARCVSE